MEARAWSGDMVPHGAEEVVDAAGELGLAAPGGEREGQAVAVEAMLGEAGEAVGVVEGGGGGGYYSGVAG